jgi:hypothetical protein
MKAMTSDQQRTLAALIVFAGGNETFQRALRSGGAETSFRDLVDRIERLRRDRVAQGAAPSCGRTG